MSKMGEGGGGSWPPNILLGGGGKPFSLFPRDVIESCGGWQKTRAVFFFILFYFYLKKSLKLRRYVD